MSVPGTAPAIAPPISAKDSAPPIWILAACLAVVLPTLLAFNLPPSATFLNQAVAFVGWGVLLFVVAAVYAVLRPDDTTVVANWLGVDRGADLLTYALVIAFVFTTLSTYLRFKELELRYARLAREVALHNARTPRN